MSEPTTQAPWLHTSVAQSEFWVQVPQVPLLQAWLELVQSYLFTHWTQEPAGPQCVALPYLAAGQSVEFAFSPASGSPASAKSSGVHDAQTPAVLQTGCACVQLELSLHFTTTGMSGFTPASPDEVFFVAEHPTVAAAKTKTRVLNSLLPNFVSADVPRRAHRSRVAVDVDVR